MIRTLAITLGLVAGFIGPAYFLEPDRLREILSALLIVLCLIGLVRWGPAAFEVYSKRAGERASMGILGVVVLLAAIAMNQAFVITNIRFNPDRPPTTHLLNAIIYLLLIGTALFVTATRFEGERPTRVGRSMMALIAVIGLLFTSVGAKLLGWIAAILTHALP